MKLGPFGFVVAALLCAACGYRSAYSHDGPGSRLTVAAAPFRSPHLGAEEALLAGVRDALGRADALEVGEGYPRIVVELVRVDEVATGIRTNGGGAPLARGSAVGVTARAWVEEASGAAPERDTGDVRRVETVAEGSDPLVGGYAFEDAARAAARRAGEGLALRVLGIAEPAVEPM